MRWLGQLIVWLVALGISAIILVAVVVPRIGGATPYTVLTGSMEPDLAPGALVVVRPVDADDIGIGSVITYQLKTGEPAVVTHRVVGISTNAEGEPRFQTQGDANASADEAWVRPVQIKGQLWYSVPVLGRANTVLNGEQRQWAVYGVAVLLLAYTAQAWIGAWRDRRRRTERSDEASTPYASTPS